MCWYRINHSKEITGDKKQKPSKQACYFIQIVGVVVFLLSILLLLKGEREGVIFIIMSFFLIYLGFRHY